MSVRARILSVARARFASALTGAIMLLAMVSAAAADGSPLPLETERELAFDVEEGTWMSVDVHPDGDRLVFDLLGDIYELPIEGGQARRLIGGLSFDSQPVFSPDGRHIAFTSDRSGSENLWIARTDGTGARQISHDSGLETFASPVWSAEGEAIFVSRREHRRDDFSLWKYYLAGESGVPLRRRDDNSGTMLDVAISEDGRYLYFAASGSAQLLPFPVADWGILRRDLITGEEAQIVASPGGAVRPQLSADGTRLVYGTRQDGVTGLRTRNLQSGEDRWLVGPVEQIFEGATPSRGLLPGYSFTPDGRSIIAGFGGRIHRIELDSGTVRPVPFSVRVELNVGPLLRQDVPLERGPVRARLIQDPVQSPDGRRLAFSALTRLYVMNLPDGEPRALTGLDTTAYQPAWSPDGRSIAFVSWAAGGGGHIWKVAATGGRPQRLSDVPGFYTDPVFSIDGEHVYALRSNARERLQLQEEVTPRRFSDLVRLSAGGGAGRVVTHAGAGATRPFVTADPERVFFTTPEGLVSVRARATDGLDTDRRLHVQIEGLQPWTKPGRPVPLAEALLSPDERWLLTRMANQLYLVAMPPAAKEPGQIDLTALSGVPGYAVSAYGADYYRWADGGDTITWAVGSSFFRRSLDSVLYETGPPPASPESHTEEIPVRVELPRDVPEGLLLLRGGTVITMRGDEVIEDADLLVANHRIAAVGARGDVDAPPGTEILEIDGRYVIPGFIDTHAHWYEIRHDVLDRQNWSYLIYLAFGITAGLDVQAMDQDAFAYQDLIDAGLMIGPRAFSVGQGLFSNNRPESAADVERLLVRHRDYYRTPNVKSYLIGNRRQRQWVVDQSRELGMLPTTEGANDLELDLTHAIDGFAGNEHALPAAHLYDDVVQLYARTGIAYTPTLLASSGGPVFAKNYFIAQRNPHDDPKLRRFMPHFVRDLRSTPAEWVLPSQWMFPRVAAGATRIARAGGLVGVGSHAEFQGVGYHWEMEALASGGMTPAEVLSAATANGAEIIGRGSELGTLEAGKYADLLILAKNPLEDIRNTQSLVRVMKNGRLYEADTLDEVWPRKRRLPSLWWTESGTLEHDSVRLPD